MAWLGKQLSRISAQLSPTDIQATLLELTVVSISLAIHKAAPQTKQIYVCGGGVHNRKVMARLKTLCKPCPVLSTSNAGVDPDFVEAAAFAWFAHQTLTGRPIALTSVTGARDNHLLGAIYPA
jgi:anhydro-N-acetylmuramic acid kinase